MSLYRIPVFWTGALIAGGGVSTFHFSDAGGTPQQAASAVGVFLAATEDRRTIGCAWSINGDVQVINTATGALQAVASVTPAGGTGTVAGDNAPPATQGLLRCLTTTIVAGRLLRGRFFLPGIGETLSSSGGAPDSAYISDYNTAANVLMNDASSVWQIWSRTHGVAGDITSATIWSKWSVLRSRRD
jgi:hypothetical protein